MTVSIIRVGYLYRWLAGVGTRCLGGVVASWDEALDTATKTAERMRLAA